jgi:hypothetical protein
MNVCPQFRADDGHSDIIERCKSCRPYVRDVAERHVTSACRAQQPLAHDCFPRKGRSGE